MLGPGQQADQVINNATFMCLGKSLDQEQHCLKIEEEAETENGNHVSFC